MLYDAVDVTFKMYLVDVEMYTGKICRIVTKTAEILDAVFTTHIPTNVMGMIHHNLGYGCCPTTATADCYLTTGVHNLSLLLGDPRLS